MDQSIVFPEQSPKWEPDRDSLSFPAMAGERQLTILVTADLLIERFHARGPSPEELDRVFRDFRANIQEIARARILARELSNNTVVLLTTQDFAFKKVTFSYKARQSKLLFYLTRMATRRLEEIVGSSSRLTTEVEWDRAEDDQGRLVVVLRLSDWSGAVSGVFTPKDLESDSITRFRLNRLWGDLLQIRSFREQQNLQESNAAVEV